MDALLSVMTSTEREILIMADHVEARISDHGDRDLICHLWFAGPRPDASAIRAVIAKVPVAKLAHDVAPDGTLTFEYGGFAIVARGLAPSDPLMVDAPEYAFAIDAAHLGNTQAIELSLNAIRANGSTGSGDAVRALAEAALAISGAGDCVAVGWRPAQSVMGSAYFARVMGDWLEGGPFPALGLVSLAVSHGDGLVSVGLRAVCGQEVEIAADAGMSAADRARLAVRLIDHLARSGAIGEAQEVEIDGFGRFNATLSDLGKKVNLTR